MIHGPANGLDLNRFEVFAKQELELEACRLQVHVIGESSLVIASTARGAWFELITCGQRLPGAQAHVRLTSGGSAAACVSSAKPGCAYAGRLFTQTVGSSPFAAPLPHAVEHRFPGPGDPATRIEVGPTGSGVRVRTRHDYPEAGLVVWSESAWEF